MSQPFYFTDSRNKVIRYVDASGVITTPALTSSDAVYVNNGGFYDPWGCALNPAGTLLFIVDEGAECVYAMDTTTLDVIRVAGAATGTLAQGYSFSDIYGVCCDSQGNVYISDPGAQQILCVNMQGSPQTILNVSIAAGDIAVVAGGSFGFSGDGGAATSAAVQNCYQAACDSSDNLLFVDQFNNRIRRVNAATGIIDTVVGSGTFGGTGSYTGDGGPPTSATLNNPLGLAIDAADNWYITDFRNSVIRVVNNQLTSQTLLGTVIAAGMIETVVPSTASVTDKLWFCAINIAGELAFCNVPNSTPPGGNVWKVDTGGAVASIAGTGTYGATSGDGGAATSAGIGEAFGVAFATTAPPPPGSGNIVVAKRTNPATSALKMFAFTPSWGSGFSLHDGQSTDSGPIVTGTYSIAETAVAGWSSSAVVSSGDPINALNLADGQTITITFTNSPTISTISTLAKVYPWVS